METRKIRRVKKKKNSPSIKLVLGVGEAKILGGGGRRGDFRPGKKGVFNGCKEKNPNFKKKGYARGSKKNCLGTTLH